VLPTFEKILELVIKRQLDDYLKKEHYNRASMGFQERILV